MRTIPTVLFMGIVLAGAVAGAAEAEHNLITNSDFESPLVTILKTDPVNARPVLAKGWDFAESPDGQVISWVPNWIPNEGGGEIRIVQGQPGKEVHGGKQCLMLNTVRNCSVYNLARPIAAGKNYQFSFSAKGSGTVAVQIYEYDNLDGRKLFLSAFTADTTPVPVSDQWQTVAGSFAAANAAAKTLGFAFLVTGQVYLDDVVVTEKE